MSWNSIQCCYLHTGIKSCHQSWSFHFLGLFDASFCYLESVGICNVVYRIHQSLLLHPSGENIRHSVRYRNPLIHSEGAHGGCHGPHY